MPKLGFELVLLYTDSINYINIYIFKFQSLGTTAKKEKAEIIIS